MSTYFSAFKWLWLLENVEAVAAAKAEGRCMVGTMDAWLMYNLTGGVDGMPPQYAHHGHMHVLYLHTRDTPPQQGCHTEATQRGRAYQQHDVLICVQFGTITICLRSYNPTMTFRGSISFTHLVELQWLALSCRMLDDTVHVPAGGIFVTDVSNAARTCLMDIHSRKWNPALLQRFQLSTDMLPRICSNAEVYGRIRDGPLADIPIAGAFPDITTPVTAAASSALIVPFLRNTFPSGVN